MRVIITDFIMNELIISRKYFVPSWELEFSLQGPLDPRTSLVVNLLDVDEIVKPCLEQMQADMSLFNLPPDDLAQISFERVDKELKLQMPAVFLQKVVAISRGREAWGSYGH